MKDLRKKVFDALNRMAEIEQKEETKNNNALKELKAAVSVGLTKMFEVCGRKFGRRSNFESVDLSEFKDIAYFVAHKYRAKLNNCDAEETNNIFLEMVAAGMEGISQGIARFDPTKDTKMSTFLFSRARFAISKYYQKLIREKKRQIVSLNAAVEDNDNNDFFSVVSDDSNHDILDTVTRNIEKQALFTVMGKLSEKERTLLQLCSERNISSVAKQFNISSAKVKTFLAIIKEKIVAEISLNS